MNAIYIGTRIYGRRCHESKSKICRCCCEGNLHGATWKHGGVRRAIRTTKVKNVQLNFLDQLGVAPDV